MKNILLKNILFCLGVILCTSAWAQAPKPEAKPVPAQPAAAKPAPVQQAAAKPAVAKSRRGQDARHCLGQPSNTAVIKCAEAYL
jgi:hypothetical protein